MLQLNVVCLLRMFLRTTTPLQHMMPGWLVLKTASNNDNKNNIETSFSKYLHLSACPMLRDLISDVFVTSVCYQNVMVATVVFKPWRSRFKLGRTVTNVAIPSCEIQYTYIVYYTFNNVVICNSWSTEYTFPENILPSFVSHVVSAALTAFHQHLLTKTQPWLYQSWHNLFGNKTLHWMSMNKQSLIAVQNHVCTAQPAVP